MEKLLYAWFCRQRSRQIPISYEILAAKAKQFYAQSYGNDNFVASRGWIARFRSRHGLRALKICGEKLSCNESAVDPFILTLSNTIKSLNILPSQVYNADESALYWKLLPEKTLVGIQEKKAPGRKMCKQRVTFLACVNSDGSHKLKILMIGKAKNPRAFKNATLPVEYKSSRNAWMTTAIFHEWFHQSFVPQVRSYLKRKNLPAKAILLVDNASSHGHQDELVSDDGCITTLFLPPNCTALIQPLDQNAIRLTKMFYRKSLLAHILSSDEREDVCELLKNITLKTAACLLHNAWEKVSPHVLQKCWNKLLPGETANNLESDDDPDDSIPLSLLRQNILEIPKELATVSDMLNSLSQGNLTEQEIRGWIENDEALLPLEDTVMEISDDEEQQEISDLKTVKNEDAIKSLNVVLKWAEENDFPLNDILVLQRLKESAFLMHQKNVKQTKITSFFNKQ